MRAHRLPSIGAVIVAAFLLTGCSGGSGYSSATAAALQAQVLSVTEAAAASDFPTTSTRLSELRVAADVALSRGDITAERHASILSAADLVQSDVDAAIESARVAAADAAAQAAADAAAQAAADAAAQAAADAEAEAEADRLTQQGDNDDDEKKNEKKKEKSEKP